MVNIIFNNKNYTVDDSLISTHSADLKQHLSTVMNGSGATINLDGTAYNVDSVKLAAAKNTFVQHLGTIVGSGHKVVIGGVEYGIDAAKVAGAIAELHAVFGGLYIDDEGSVFDPIKNEYGFYYNVPYYRDEGDYTCAYVFHENNTYSVFGSNSAELCGVDSDALFVASGEIPFEMTDLVINFAWGDKFIFADDGGSFESISSQPGESGTFVAAAEIVYSVYYGETYVAPTGSEVESVCFYEDGTAIIVAKGETITVSGVYTYSSGYGLTDFVTDDEGNDVGTFEADMSIDGNECILWSEYSPDGIILTRSDNNNDKIEK